MSVTVKRPRSRRTDNGVDSVAGTDALKRADTYTGGILGPVQKLWDGLRADPVAGDAWDERERRIHARVATDEDERLQTMARQALAHGRRIPEEARQMPRTPPLPSLTHSAETERAIRLGIPTLIAAEVTGDNWHESPAIAATRLLQGGTTIVVLSGERGAGKTLAAAVWLWHYRPQMVRSTATSRAFVPYDVHDDMKPDKREEMSRAAALVLDDAGAEKDREAMATTLVRRYRGALPTVITTNLSRADFEDHFGARVWDRMREVARFESCGARSLRRARGGSPL